MVLTSLFSVKIQKVFTPIVICLREQVSGTLRRILLYQLVYLLERQLKELHMQPLIWLRSEEHTSELQSRFDLVCRLLLEKKNNLFEELNDRRLIAHTTGGESIHQSTEN